MPINGEDFNNATSHHLHHDSTVSTISKAEQRKSNKPIMEKRRRARINNCLNELKTLILEAMKKDPARHTKLEKADILEMTVKHLQNLQKHQQQTISIEQHQNTVVHKYRSGFNECVSEVSRFIAQLEDIEVNIKQRLVTYLANLILIPNPNPNPTSNPNSKTATSLTSLGSFNESVLTSKTTLPSTSIQPQNHLPTIPTQPQMYHAKKEVITSFSGDVNNNFNSRMVLLPTQSPPNSTYLNRPPNTAISLVVPRNVAFTNINGGSKHVLMGENSAFTSVNQKTAPILKTEIVLSPNESSPTSTNYCDENMHNLRFYNMDISSQQSTNSSLSNSVNFDSSINSSSSASSTFNDQHSHVSSSTNLSSEPSSSIIKTNQIHRNQYQYQPQGQGQSQIQNKPPPFQHQLSNNERETIISKSHYQYNLKRGHDHCIDVNVNDSDDDDGYPKNTKKRMAIHLSPSATSAFQAPKLKTELDRGHDSASTSTSSSSAISVSSLSTSQHNQMPQNDMWRPW